MARKGPAPVAESTLRATGSSLLRKKPSERATEPVAWRREKPPAMHVREADEALLRMLPRYDPFRDAGARTGTDRGAWTYASGLRFSPSRAVRAVNWIQQRCTHIKGALGGTSLVLTRHQRAIVANLFGWLREDGTRRYRRMLLYVARKFGKTLLGAAILLYVLCEDNEQGSEVYCAAGTREQAKLLWAPAKGMIRNDRYLSRRLRAFLHSIARLDADGFPDDSFFQAICAEANTAHGANPAAFAMDELHTQPDPELLEVLQTGTASRSQPLELDFTTAPFLGDTICNQVYEEACKVRDGVLSDPSFLPVIFEADAGLDWRSEEAVRQANPHYPETPTAAYIAEARRRAEREPRFLNAFKRLHLNLRTSTETVWIPLAEWDACAGSVSAADGDECFAAFDLASTRDMTAIALLFPSRGNAVLPFYFVPEDTAREERVRQRYGPWIAQGFLETTPGNVCDYGRVRAKLNELGQRFRIRAIAYDRWGATQLATDLQGDGFELVQFGQGYGSMSAPSKELEKLVYGRQIAHGGNPVLRWNVANAAIEEDAAGNIKPTKARSTGKIDGLVTTVMALGLATAAEPAAAPTVTFIG